MIEKTLIIQNENGFHLRPASNFVRVTSKFNSNISVTKDGVTINGKSILGLMSLSCEKGSEIILTVEGEDEEIAFKTLEELVNNKFNIE